MTLVEMLVALALVAVGAGAVALALPDRASERGVAQEADLLVARLNLAAERSLVEGRHFRMTWDAGGYGFAAWDAEQADGPDAETGWRPSRDALLPERHALSPGARLRVAGSGAETPVVIGPDLLPPHGGALVWRVVGETASPPIRFDGLRAAMAAGS